MKKLSIFSILTLFIVLVLSNACKKDDFTEKDAIKLINNNALTADSIANAVYLSVKAVDASTNFSFKSASDLKSAAGLTGVSITVKADGSTQTQTTGADGSATFSNLRAGTYSVHMELANYTSVDFVTSANSNGYFSVQIPVLSTAAASLMTITGTVTCETNLLNTAQELASGVKVLVQPNLSTFIAGIAGVNDFSYSGYVTSFTTDANGVYTAAVPADYAGILTYNVSIPTFEANQTLMLNTLNGAAANGPGNSAKTVATRFGTGAGTATAVPSVPSVYCVFGAPTLATSAATFLVQTDNSNTIDKAYVTNQGAGYGDGAVVTVANPNTNGTAGSVTLHVDGNTGQIQYLEVTGAGSKFTTTPTVNLAFELTPAVITVTTVGAGGTITAATITNAGSYLSNKLITAGGATINTTLVGNTFQVSSVTGGLGYTIGATVPITVPSTVATASLTLSTPHVSSVAVVNPGSGYAPSSTTIPVIFSYGNAVATAYTDTKGQVYRVAITAGGSGYTTVPTASIAGQPSNKTATASVFVQNGDIQSLFGFDGGLGYAAVPTLTFYNQYLAGNPAITVNNAVTINTATTVVNAPTITATVGANLSKNLAAANGAGPVSSLKSVPGGKEYLNFYLGTGVRTVGE